MSFHKNKRTLVFLWDYKVLFDTIKNYIHYEKIIIVDSAKKKYPLDRYYDWFDLVYEVDDIFNYKSMKNLLNKIKEEVGSIEVLISPYEALIEMAGSLRDEFDIDGMGSDVAVKVRNKKIMKQAVKDIGIKTAQIRRISTQNDLLSFIDEVGYPVIVKPISGFTTRDTFKLSDYQEYMGFVNAYFSSDVSRESDIEFVVERFINGEEYCCDSMVHNGQVIFSVVTKYLYNCLDTVGENGRPSGGIMYPGKSIKSNINVDRIKKLNDQVINTLDINNTICHSEFFVTDDKDIYFGEIGARLGGGSVIPLCIKNSYAIDFYKAYVELAMGIYNHDIPKLKNVYSGVIMFPFKDGKIFDISTVESFNEYEGLVDIQVNKSIGDVCHINVKSSIDSTGFAIMEDLAFEGLHKRLIKIYDDFKLEVECNEMEECK